jgi:hypothetical protein
MSGFGNSRKARKPIRKVSKKQETRMARYFRIRNPYIKANPICMICKAALATDLHHRRGRIGKLLFDSRWFMALCRNCHSYLHEHVAWAKEKGYLVPYWRVIGRS